MTEDDCILGGGFPIVKARVSLYALDTGRFFAEVDYYCMLYDCDQYSGDTLNERVRNLLYSTENPHYYDIEQAYIFSTEGAENCTVASTTKSYLVGSYLLESEIENVMVESGFISTTDEGIIVSIKHFDLVVQVCNDNVLRRTPFYKTSKKNNNIEYIQTEFDPEW